MSDTRFNRRTIRLLTRSLMLAVTVGLAGCEGVGVPAADDPDVKLSQAESLKEIGRIMQARRMTEQAIALFEKRNDKAGLGRAYREYGLVALHGGLGDDPIILVLDPKMPFKPRPGDLRDAEFNFKRARDLLTETGQADLVANINFLLGNIEALRGNTQAACSNYDVAIQDFADIETHHPDMKFNMPPGATNPIDYVGRAKTEAGCSPAPAGL